MIPHFHFTNRLFVLVLLSALALQLSAQNLVITESTTAQEAAQMVHDMLVSGGIQVTDVQYTGYPQASGTFSGETGTGFTSGLLLTSGKAGLALGPNNLTGAGRNNGLAGDPDLNVLADDDTYDASVLNFDFIPSANHISLRFVFASEEYPEGVNANWNDAFGIFLSGPGIDGPFANSAINLAVLPGTDIPVSVNTVNSDSNAVFFVNNWNPVVNNYLQYDGYTVVLTAEAYVQAFQTYHLKIAIADGGDKVYDSGLWIMEDSFTDGVVTGVVSNSADLPFVILHDQANHGFEVRPTNTTEADFDLRLYDLMGRNICHRSNNLKFEGLQPGVFILVVESSQGSFATKVMVR